MRAQDKRNVGEAHGRYWGGMRNPRTISTCLPGYRTPGAAIYAALQKVMQERDDLMQKCLNAIGSEDADAGPNEDDRAFVRERLRQALHVESSNKHGYDAMLDVELLWAMGRSMGDPDAGAVRDWLTNGAPAGISRPTADPGNIFPPDLQDEAADLHRLPDHLDHCNYSSVHEDDAAEEEVNRLQDWLRQGVRQPENFSPGFRARPTCRNWR